MQTLTINYGDQQVRVVLEIEGQTNIRETGGCQLPELVLPDYWKRACV